MEQVINTSSKNVERSGELEEDMRELQEIFTVLEEDRKHLQALLLQRKEEHEKQLNALEMEMNQQRLEWERVMREREEALRCALITLAIGRVKLMSDLRSHMEKQSLALLLRPTPVPAVKVEQPRKLCCKKEASPDAALESTKHLREADGNPPVVNQKRQSRKWWSFKRHQATADVALQDVSTSSDAKDADLQKIAKLEKRIRRAEFKKQRKAAKKTAKAEKKAKKAEQKKVKKEAKKAEKEGKKAEKEAKKVKENSPQGQSV